MFTQKRMKSNNLLERPPLELDKLKTLTKTDYFLIDIVDFNNIDSFLDEIEIEIKALIHSYVHKND